MGEFVSPEAQEAIETMAREISVSHRLDPEIQEELASHMEDKLCGYLSGEERLSEEDALVLVREHFGDPEEVSNLLSATHWEEAGGNALRRALVATILFFSLAAIGNLIVLAGQWVSFPLMFQDAPWADLFTLLTHYGIFLGLGILPGIGIAPPAIWISILAILYLRGRKRGGPTFRWSTRSLCIAALASLVIFHLIPQMVLPVGNVPQLGGPPVVALTLIRWSSVIFPVLMFAHCLAWLLWCSWGRSVIVSFTWWFGLHLTTIVLPMLSVYFIHVDMISEFSLPILLQGPLVGEQWQWQIYSHSGGWHFFVNNVGNHYSELLAGILALLVFGCIRLVKSRVRLRFEVATSA